MKNLLLSLALFLLPGNIAIHSTESGSSSPSWIEILESDFFLDAERKQDLSLLPLNSWWKGEMHMKKKEKDKQKCC